MHMHMLVHDVNKMSQLLLRRAASVKIKMYLILFLITMQFLTFNNWCVFNIPLWIKYVFIRFASLCIVFFIWIFFCRNGLYKTFYYFQYSGKNTTTTKTVWKSECVMCIFIFFNFYFILFNLIRECVCVLRIVRELMWNCTCSLSGKTFVFSMCELPFEHWNAKNLLLHRQHHITPCVWVYVCARVLVRRDGKCCDFSFEI